MSRYTGSLWKISRRLDISLSDTGRELAHRPYRPGQHEPNSHGRVPECRMQLTEKQKLCHMHGMNERQSRTLLIKTNKIKEGKHGVNFMILPEQHLDNVVCRLGLTATRCQTCQLVDRSHTTVNDKRVDIPPYHVEVGQVIGIREKSQNISTIKGAIEAAVGRPVLISSGTEKLESSFTRLPERDELHPKIGEALVVEYYNQRL